MTTTLSPPRRTAPTRGPHGDPESQSDHGPSEWTLPRYFGPDDTPRFGVLHLPAGGWSGTRVVLCPPVGYEGLFAHPSLRDLALRLARDPRAAVHRPDYFGTGDSAGTDEASDLVEQWIDSIVMAVEDVRTCAPSDEPLVLVGMRAGALLAIEAARRLGGVDGLVLWAPVVSGKAFVREQRAMSRTAHLTYSDFSEGRRRWGEKGFEAAGYVFTESTSDALSALDGPEGPAPAGRVLVLDRDDMPGAAEAYRAWSEAGAAVDYDVADGYQGMMQPPISLEPPTGAIAKMAEWIGGLATGKEHGGCPRPEPSTDARVAPSVRESAVWYDGEEGSLFGILTEPRPRPKKAFLVLNNAHGNRTGPAGLFTWCARKLAEGGAAATFRIDVAGVGDSGKPAARPEHHSYGLDAIADVTAAVQFLRDRGYDEIYTGGLCSGAYLAWHAALDEQFPSGLILINQQTFLWRPGDGLAVDALATHYESEHYKQSARSLAKWLKLLRGQVDLRYLASTMFDAAALKVDSVVQAAKARLPFGFVFSETVADLQEMLEAGVKVHFLFSGNDPGITNLNREVGPHIGTLRRNWGLDVRVVEGPDHSFTSRAAWHMLHERLDSILKNPGGDDRD